MQRRSARAQRSIVMVTAALAAGTAGYLLGSVVAGLDVPASALAVAMAASWLCIGALLFVRRAERSGSSTADDDADTAFVVPAARSPRTTRADLPGSTAFARDLDPVSGLLRYKAARDDRFVARTGGLPGAVVVVEIVDHVTATALAPAVADRLVADAAARVMETASTYGAVVRRLNGPQLALLLPGLDEPALTALASMLHDGTTTGWVPGVMLRDGSQPVRLVAGIAIAADEADQSDDIAALIRSATAAAAQAKRQGSEAPVVFHDRLADEARERLSVGRALRTAIDERNISLVYQPQVDLVDGSLLGVEVLARWHDPVLGAISPDRFVRIAAEIGMSWQLDRLVFEKAFAQLGDWDAAGVAVPRIFVNVSPETIAEGRRVGLRNLLASYSISPERVTVELVNSGLLDGQLGVESVQRYRDLGLQVTLDDFGAGESSFSQLTVLPVTGLKIHRSLLAGDAGGADVAALGAIIQAGTSLGLAVAAVGIETSEQRDLLRGLGCAAGQGYLYSAPLSPAELVAWLRVPNLVG